MKTASAAFILLCLTIGLYAQQLNPDLEQALGENRVLTDFRMKPEQLLLVPQYYGMDHIVESHRDLKAHAVQEALFLLPPASQRPDSELAYYILRETPNLSGLRYHLSRTRSYKLFNQVRFIEFPTPAETNCVIEIDDENFGVMRFRAVTETYWNRIELRMINLDPYKYLFFTLIPEEHALIDLVYFPGKDRSLMYTAWSVRSSLFIPRMVDVETLLYRRALAVNRWFAWTLENIEE